MKLTISYDLESEKEEFETAYNAEQMKNMLCDFYTFLSARSKDIQRDKKVLKETQEIKQVFCKLANKLNILELTRMIGENK